MNQATADEIPITAEAGIDIEQVKSTKLYQGWLASFDRKRFKVKSVHLQSVDAFNSRVAFIKLKADVVDEKGRFVPGIIFMRGGSVGILPVFYCQGECYVVLTVQPRLATGSFEFVELPAGMLDDSGNFAGAAAKEIAQELGVTISENDLTSLSELAGHERGFFVSPGGTDETIRLFAFVKQISKDELDAFNGKCTGIIEEGEQITLKIVQLRDLPSIPDGKAIVAYTLYELFGHLVKKR